MKIKRPTIIDVAEYAGVSKSTVSLVLQDSELVKNETRELVLNAMQEIGYVYNRNAAKLRSDQNGLVGLVINDLRNPFFSEFATSFQMALTVEGYSTVVANTDESEKMQEQVVRSMIEHGVSALVLSPTYTNSGKLFDHIERANIPAFQVLRQITNDTEKFPFFSFDYENGGRLAVRHLIEQGCKNIAFVGGMKGSDITTERMMGYIEDHVNTGKKLNVFHGKPSKDFGRRTAIEIVELHPEIDGCLCFNDLVALGMNTGFTSKKVVVGSEMLVIGFDDIEDCKHVFPQLTSIHCEIAEFGRYVANSLLTLMTSGVFPTSSYRCPVQLSVRESTMGKRFDDI